MGYKRLIYTIWMSITVVLIMVFSISSHYPSKTDMHDAPTYYTPEATALPSLRTVIADGRIAWLNAYVIDGDNFFMLRDIAAALNGTGSQFEITWDDDSNAVNILTGLPHMISGNEGRPGINVPAAVKSSATAFYIDGQSTDLTAYVIGGNNYFMLCDLSNALNFSVDYRAVARGIIIVTSENTSPSALFSTLDLHLETARDAKPIKEAGVSFSDMSFVSAGFEELPTMETESANEADFALEAELVGNEEPMSDPKPILKIEQVLELELASEEGLTVQTDPAIEMIPLRKGEQPEPNYWWTSNAEREDTGNMYQIGSMLMEIIGSEPFVKQVISALELIQEKSPEHFEFVSTYIGAIEEVDMIHEAAIGFFETVPTMLVSKRAAYNYGCWLGGCIIHEAFHVKQLDDFLRANYGLLKDYPIQGNGNWWADPNNPVLREIWAAKGVYKLHHWWPYWGDAAGVERAELEANKAQLEYLILAGAREVCIDVVREMPATRWWEVLPQRDTQ